jgi:NAD+ diphosphatase
MKYWFIFCKSDILLEKYADGHYTIPCSEESPVLTKPWTHIMNIAPMSDGTEIKTFSIDDPSKTMLREFPNRSITNDTHYEMCGLRSSYYKIPLDLYMEAGKCSELLYWDKNTQFCGVCGSPMKMHTNISKRCTNCGKEVWPQLATAVIVLIHRDDKVLLVQARNFRTNFYGLVAGFVETGETLEDAVYREVKEETSLKITNLRYFGSQPWPYPCGLMVGYNADYVSGEIHLQKEELNYGNWFSKDNLPTIPEKLSIARKILDDWLKEKAPADKVL